MTNSDSIWVWVVDGVLSTSFCRPKQNIIMIAELVKEITEDNNIIVHKDRNGYNDELSKFTSIMYFRLVEKHKKYHRKTWKTAEPLDLLSYLRKQVDKLEETINENENISEKSADVANIAMMIADVCGVL
jgi:hypothetical protein